MSKSSNRSGAMNRTTTLTFVWVVIAVFMFNFGIVGAKPSGPLCDFDGDSDCDSDDIDDMYTANNHNLVTGEAVVNGVNDQYDLVADGTINNLDLSEWLDQAGTENGFASAYLRGDTDDLDTGSSRDIDIVDFNTVASNFNPTGSGSSWTIGNFDGDGDVDISDFNTVASNFAPTGYGGAEGVPEPSTMVLCMMGLIFGTGVAFCRKRLWT